MIARPTSVRGCQPASSSDLLWSSKHSVETQWPCGSTWMGPQPSHITTTASPFFQASSVVIPARSLVSEPKWVIEHCWQKSAISLLLYEDGIRAGADACGGTFHSLMSLGNIGVELIMCLLITNFRAPFALASRDSLQF